MTKHSLGWIGMGRMGYPMAERLLKTGHSVAIWNRPALLVEPLAKQGGKIVDQPTSLPAAISCSLLVSTGKDLEQVCFATTACLPAPRARAQNPGRLFLDRGLRCPRRSATG